MALFRSQHSLSIEQVKALILTRFSIIAFVSSFLLFASLALWMVLHEDKQIELHLRSFDDVAQKHYQMTPQTTIPLSEHVTAYFHPQALPLKYQSLLPYTANAVTRYKSMHEQGYMVFHRFIESAEGQLVPMYLTIDARAIDFGDNNWNWVLILAMVLVFFLVVVLRFALKQAVEGLIGPIAQLHQQLREDKDAHFQVTPEATLEIKQLAEQLNDYKAMKERVAKQELMFANFASHELKTPIAIILGAANLQGMKADSAFQEKQRKRIVSAGERMRETVELLLNIVKQQNVGTPSTMNVFERDSLDLENYRSFVSDEVELSFDVESQITTNLSLGGINMILKNLIDNAARFTEQGQILVVINTNLIEVRDTGVGLDPSAPPQHGLGLLIVKRIANSYGWAFSIDNQQNGVGCVAKLERKT